MIVTRGLGAQAALVTAGLAWSLGVTSVTVGQTFNPQALNPAAVIAETGQSLTLSLAGDAPSNVEVSASVASFVVRLRAPVIDADLSERVISLSEAAPSKISVKAGLLGVAQIAPPEAVGVSGGAETVSENASAVSSQKVTASRNEHAFRSL